MNREQWLTLVDETTDYPGDELLGQWRDWEEEQGHEGMVKALAFIMEGRHCPHDFRFKENEYYPGWEDLCFGWYSNKNNMDCDKRSELLEDLFTTLRGRNSVHGATLSGKYYKTKGLAYLALMKACEEHEDLDNAEGKVGERLPGEVPPPGRR